MAGFSRLLFMGKNIDDMNEREAQQEQHRNSKANITNLAERGIGNTIHNHNTPHGEEHPSGINNNTSKGLSNSNTGYDNNSTHAPSMTNNNSSLGEIGSNMESAGKGSTAGNASGGAASGGASTISSGAAASSGSAGGGAAAGATAGSVAPVVGTAVGAAAGSAMSAAKKASPLNNQKPSDNVFEKGSGKGTSTDKKKSNSVVDDHSIAKVAICIFSVIIVTMLLLSSLMTLILDTVASPVMALWKQAQEYIEFSDSLLSDLGISSSREVTYEDLVNLIVKEMGTAMEDAYTKVCYKEVYQIAIENDYDIDLTMESYQKTKFPYDLEGEDCNVNYAELLSLITLSGKFDSEHYKDFDYDEFCLFLKDEEFQRCLYDLDVVPTYIINSAALKEGESGKITVNNNIVTVAITHKDGTQDTYTGDAAKPYYILYGEVSVGSYPVKKLYDYYGIDPYAKHEIFYNMPNYKAISQMNYFSKYYYPDIFWGTEAQSPIAKSYKKLTGELTTDVMNCYEQDLFDLSLFKETDVYLETPYYSQVSGELANLGYYYKGTKKPVHTWGCCLVSMCMVCSYFSPETSAMDAYNYYLNDLHGSLNRSQMAEHYGFKQLTTDDKHFNSEKVMGELSQGRLVIAHIRPLCLGSSGGHYIVITGYSLQSDEPYFTVNDPAHVNRKTLTVAECVANMDGYRSYGK